MPAELIEECGLGHERKPFTQSSRDENDASHGDERRLADLLQGPYQEPKVFSHGKTLSAGAFEDQMFFLVRNGYRMIGRDRRGHGHSNQP